MAPRKPSDAVAHSLGRDALGPAFVAFAHLLLRHARRRGHHRLAFVARDGDLLLRTVTQLSETSGGSDRPELAYVYLSRRATALPARPQVDAFALAEALAARAGQGTLREALDFLGIPLPIAAPVLDRLGIDAGSPCREGSVLTALLADRHFQAAVAGERDRQRDTLAAYLVQEGVGWGPPTLLVDIGWRGSILWNLEQAFVTQPRFQIPAGAFFGLWSEDGRVGSLPPDSVGLVSDVRRRRNVVEGAAWYAAFLLEAVCRANEGTTVGYAARQGRIEPVLAGESASRRREEATADLAQTIREGILDFVTDSAGDPRWQKASDVELRRIAQHALLRLACFPSADEIAVGAQLVHTEGHAEDWSASLIAADRPHPLRTPRRWLAGLASPWRAGYVRSTGGPLLAGGFLLAESLLLALPPAARGTLTTLARRMASIGERR